MPHRDTSATRLTNTLLLIIAVVVLAVALRFISAIMLPLALAVLLLFVFTPITHLLQKRLRFPRALSVLVVLTIFITVGALVGMLLYSSVRSLLSNYGFYQQRFQLLIETLVDRYNLTQVRVNELTNSLGLSQALRSFLISSTSNILSFVSGFTLVTIFLFFLLVEQDTLSQRVTRAFNTEQVHKIQQASRLIYQRITRYLITKVLVSALTALLTFVVFSLIGIDFPVVWAALTFLFNFIPSIGSIIITLLSVLFAVAQFAPHWTPVVVTLVSAAVIQFGIGNILEPKLLGDSLNLSPVVIILSLLLWGYLWGVVGMFVAVPLTVIIKNVLEQIPITQSIARMMGSGRGRATP